MTTYIIKTSDGKEFEFVSFVWAVFAHVPTVNQLFERINGQDFELVEIR